MSDTGDIVVDVAGFRQQVDRFAHKYGFNAGQVMRDQMRLWVKDLIKRTPPKTLAQGRKAVARDLQKIFVAIDQPGVVEFYRENFAEKNIPPSVPWNLEGDHARMAQMHGQYRTNKGQVRFRAGRAKAGQMDFIRAMYVPGRAFRSYQRTAQSHVGKLKAGWVRAANRFGAKVPSFVSRQSVKMGDATDRMGDDGSGYLEAINRVPWCDKLRGILLFTAKVRERDVTTQLHKRLDKMAREFSAERAI